jgi:signal transduction histidine kinase
MFLRDVADSLSPRAWSSQQRVPAEAAVAASRAEESRSAPRAPRPRGAGRGSLERRLYLSLLLLGVLPLLIGGTLAYEQFRRYVGDEVTLTMRAMADGARVAVAEFLDYVRGRTLDIASDWFISDSLDSGETADLSRYLRVQRSLLPESDGVFVLSPGGRVIASSDPDAVGLDRGEETYFAAALEGPVITDMRLDDQGHPLWVVAAPIRSRRSGEVIGVVGNRINPRALSDVVTGESRPAPDASAAAFRPGTSGEVYIVNNRGFMITESRFVPHAVLTEHVATLPIREASHGESVFADYRDYRGVPITGASALIPEMGWTVIAERDASEAFAPAARLRLQLLALGFGVLPAILALALLLYRDILRPMRRLIGADQRVLDGGALDGVIPEAELPSNEWARVISVRNDMLRRLGHEQAWHEAQVERQRREAQHFTEIVRSINARAPLGGTLQLIAETARELCGADSAEVALSTAPPSGAPARFSAGPLDDDGDGGAERRAGRRLTQAITLAEGPVGLVRVERAAAAEFEETDRVSLTRLASHAAVAIENARFYEASRDAAEQKDRFLATLAHELRTPLSVVLHAVEALDAFGIDPTAKPVERADLRAMIRRQVGHTMRLVADLLDVSRIGAGKLRLDRETVDLGAVVRDAVAAMMHRGRSIDLEIAAGPLTVQGDATRLDQIVKNLLDNAFKYSPAESVVAVRVSSDGRDALLSVQDQGMGIAPEQVPQLFRAYMQADAALPHARGGLGLGLALVRGIAEAHGGQVLLQSDGLGKGTCATIRLPLAQAMPPTS